MPKKILRIASLLLVLVLVASLFPATASTAAGAADQTEAERVTALANNTYRKALNRASRYSFYGWCGAAVDWQMYVLGITTKMVGSNGNDKFDQYRYMDYTSGGYTVDAYPASKYNLAGALNTITNNGTKDAYNIMVGFQWSNTSAGRYYGHAVYIYAIVDGIVYFTESFGMTFNGKYYNEGKCMSGTIAEFAKAYNSWCTLDGVIHFGLKTYSDECQFLNAYLYAAVTKETTLYSEPCTPDVDDRSVAQRQLQVGERLNVVGMYCNTEGEYWYQVEDADIGYVLASDTEMISLRYDDVQITGAKAPTVLTEGGSFSVRGSVVAKYVNIVSVRAQVYATTEDGIQHMMTTNATATDNEYNLYRSTVANRLNFKLLDVGSYHFELAVVVNNYYYADGDLQNDWQTVKLWKSDFQVVERKGQTASVTFDANGGIAELNAAEMNLGQMMGTLPTAEREGYIFDGWCTADGELVDEEYVLEGSMTLYARWVADEEVTGWFWQDGQVYYVENGIRPQGFFQVDGITYHHNAEGLLDIGWIELEGRHYYFFSNGAMAIGWLTLEESTYYMGADGAMTVGWLYMDDASYYFDEDGKMVVGTVTIGDTKFYFGDDGTLIKDEVILHQQPNIEISPMWH